MEKSKKEKILMMRIEYPQIEQEIKTYVGVPTDYILRKRLHLDEAQVQSIRLAYALYQDTVREVLEAELEKLKIVREIREKNMI